MCGKPHKPTIVLISHWAASLGGAEYSLIDIARYLAPRAYTHLITTESGPLVDTMQNSGITCHVIATASSLIRVKRERLVTNLLGNIPGIVAFLRYVKAAHKLLSTIHPECIHANVPKSHITLLLLRILGIQCRGIIHFREIFPQHSMAYHLYRTLYQMSRQPDVIAISSAVRDALPPSMQKQAIIIYNGVAVSPAHKKKQTLSPVRFLYLGRVVPWKGCDFLIEAFLQMYTRRQTICSTLSLIGDTSYWKSSYRDQLSARIQSRKAESVISLQGHSNSIDDILFTHDVLCLPSLHEPFGRSAAEAQGAGLPVIAWNSGALPEVIEQGTTGILTPVNDLQAFSHAMEQFIENPAEMRRMGSEGRCRTERLFNRVKQVPQIGEYILSKSSHMTTV